MGLLAYKLSYGVAFFITLREMLGHISQVAGYLIGTPKYSAALRDLLEFYTKFDLTWTFKKCSSLCTECISETCSCPKCTFVCLP